MEISAKVSSVGKLVVRSRLQMNSVFLSLCLLMQIAGGALGNTIPDINDNDEYGNARDSAQQSSRDVIMREDAEEIFYKVDLQRYDDLGVVCPIPEAPENGYLVGRNTRVGSVAYVRCEKGYRLEGPTVMVCVAKGDVAGWNADIERKCVEFKEPAVEDGEGGEEEEETENENEDENAPNEEFSEPISMSDPRFLKQRPISKTVVMEDESPVSEELLERLPAACVQPAFKGPCKALFRRYYFDTKFMECRHFTYGGCMGNENNFESMEKCDESCHMN